MDNQRILEFASACSAANLSQPDAVSGLRSAAEIEALEKTFERKVLL
jgi:sugar/nucleoside kinase (ribokinase family)